MNIDKTAIVEASPGEMTFHGIGSCLCDFCFVIFPLYASDDCQRQRMIAVLAAPNAAGFFSKQNLCLSNLLKVVNWQLDRRRWRETGLYDPGEPASRRRPNLCRGSTQTLP